MSLLELLSNDSDDTDSKEINWTIIKTITNISSAKEKDTEGNLSLHLACKNNAPLDVVKLLVETYPDAVKENNKREELPLHLACRNNVPLDVIKLLVESYPDSIKEKNREGQLALHLACNACATIEIVKLLIEGYLDATKEKNLYGHLPLHYACDVNAPIDVIMLLVEAYPDATKEKDNSDSFPLHHACRNNAPLDVIKQLIKPYPDAIKEKDGSLDCLPLHLACQCNAPIDVIMIFMEAYPDATKEKDSIFYSLPLHDACKSGAPIDVIKILVEAHPDSTKVKDRYGALPLHYACNKDNVSVDIINLLVQMYPDSTKEKDDRESLPLHYACKQNAQLGVIKLLLEIYPDAIKEKNRGDLPLHYACESGASMDVIKVMIDLYPDSVKEKNDHGYLPLHVACKNGSIIDVIKLLLEIYPNAIKEKNNDGSLPLHIATYVDIDVIKLLLQLYPDATKEISNTRALPLHLACQCNAPIDVIKLLVEAFPDALKKKDSQGFVPLHFACEKNASFDVIKLLIETYPDALKETCINKYLPLHYACEKNAPLDVIKLMIDIYPGSIKMRNKISCLPLHVSCNKNTHIDVIKLLIELYPDAIKEIDMYMSYPLHYACEKGAPIDVIKLLMEADPTIIKRANNRGNLPLHFACKNNAPFNVIKLLVEEYADATRRENRADLLPIQCGEGESSKEVIYYLLAHDIPIHANHGYSWTRALEKYKSNISLCKYLVKTLFDQYHAQEPEVCHKLAHSKDELGRSAVSIVSEDVLKLINQYLLFMGRFEMKVGPPEHKSNTCVVIIAVDHDNQLKKNALKFMRNRDGFFRELTSRDGIDTAFVLPIEHSFDGTGSTESDKKFLSYLEKVETLKEYKYMLALPASERSLAAMILHEHICGSDWAKIKQILRDLILCLDAVHAAGKIHGDIKPLNAMRLNDGQICLIDMDAATLFGDICGAKISSAYIPPEMIVTTMNETYDINTKLPASISYDMWGLGAVLYNLCTGETLFQANTDDNLVDASSWQSLSTWSNETKSMKLSKISDTAARNLVSQLLHKDPLKRPDTKHILTHPFLTGRVAGRLPGDDPEYDVFLSYRVATDKDLVETMYNKLTMMGLRVFWDKICLEAGKDWEEGFAVGLCGSGIFVPVISRGALKSRYESLHAESNVDNVLLEHRLALELNALDLVTHIYPIYVGDVDGTGNYGYYFSSDAVPNAPDITVVKLEAAAISQLDRLGLGLPLIPNITVKGIVDRINKSNGGFVQGNDLDSILSILCNNIAKIVTDKKTIQAVLSSESLSPSDDTITILRQQVVQLTQLIDEKEQKLEQKEQVIIDREKTIRELNSRLALYTSS